MFANTLNFFYVSNTLQSQVISEKVIFKQEELPNLRTFYKRNYDSKFAK